MKKFFFFILGGMAIFLGAQAQTAIQTSFEVSQGYPAGAVHGINNWTRTSGIANVYTTKAKEGTQSLNIAASNTALLVNNIKYAGNVSGLQGDVYADLWVNIPSGGITTKSLGVNGYDLYGGSSKRAFVIEFNAAGKIRAFNGSSGTDVGTWTADTWVRVSLKADFELAKYKVAVNGTVFATELSFRETYTPTLRYTGEPVVGKKEFHSLRFNHLDDTGVSTTDAAVDSFYVGTTPISDISFGASSTTRTITVTQPAYGSIALSPAGPYNLNQSVTATLTVPTGYQNNGWTGDLSGTELVKTFTVTGNMAFGANVAVDPSNPPPTYRIYLQQPQNGSITLSPVPAADSLYYKETKVTATIAFEACYQFNGWTGALSGTSVNNTFTVQSDATIGAMIAANTTASVKRIVTSKSTFQTAVAAMNPGDSIEVADGSYDLGFLTFSRSGCSDKPIVIYAKNKGQATLNGGTSLKFSLVNYITFSGFNIESVSVSTGIKIENSTHIRITNCRFALVETSSCTWIYMGDTFGSTNPLISGHHRIDHNLFENKTQTGTFIKMDGNATEQTQYDTIEYNHFKNNQPRATNEKECIRVGYSAMSMSSGFTLIQYNLFEDCDGDPEIVSIKSCDNIVRYNTFVRSLGTLSLRHGNRTLVEGNYFFGEGKTVGTNGTGGIRVYGKDHVIINNYFTGLTGSKFDAAITITNGDALNTSTSLDKHFVPENVTVAYNTLVNNKANIEIGFDNASGSTPYNIAPKNCNISNNVITEDTNPIIKSYSASSLAGVTFSNNMMYPTGTATVGITYNASQITIADPVLVQPACITPAVDCNLTNAYKVLRLSSGSPAINAGVGSFSFNAFAELDNEGQTRQGVKDMGADEFDNSGVAVISALDAVHVGPNAIPFTYTYTFGPLPIKELHFYAKEVNKEVEIFWTVKEESGIKDYVVEWSTDGRIFKTLGTIISKNSFAFYSYSFMHNSPASGINYYRLRIIDQQLKATYTNVQKVVVGSTRSMSLYPNPANQFVQIQTEIGKNKELIIYSISGLLIKKYSLAEAGGLQKISVAEFAAGTYIAQLNAEGSTPERLRFVVTHF